MHANLQNYFLLAKSFETASFGGNFHKNSIQLKSCLNYWNSQVGIDAQP